MPGRSERPFGLQSGYGELGLRIARKRSRLGMTQEELAELIALSRGSIANIEAGNQRVNLHDIGAFAQALRTQVSTLIKGLWQ